MVKNLCKGKSVKSPNRCKKVQGCKVAKGPKRTYCRKKHNNTQKKSKAAKKTAKKMSSKQKRLARTRRVLKKLGNHSDRIDNYYLKYHAKSK